MKKLFELFMIKNCKKAKNNEFRIENVINKLSCMLNRKAMISHLTDGLIKKILYKSESIFS